MQNDEQIQDFVYDFHREQPEFAPPIVHWFEMQKRGAGWTTRAYFHYQGHVACPLMNNGADPLPDEVPRQFRNMSAIRLHFREYHHVENNAVLHCVVNAHCTQPATIFQLVLENVNPAARRAFCDSVRNHQNGRGLSYSLFLRVPWVSALNKGALDEWTTY